MSTFKKSPNVRCPFGCVRAICFLSFAFALMITEASGQVENAVVKVVSRIAGKSYEGIGFAYQPANTPKVYVVTALHVVAGSAKIEIQTAEEKKLADAKIHKFFRKADLVLLEPLGPLNISPLQLHTGAFPTTGNIWSISQQRVGANDMRLGKEKPLIDLFKRERSPKQREQVPPLTPQEVNQHFDPHYYPDTNAPVLELEKSIGPGDSGSPITYDDAVISMVDGGLHNLGGIKKAWWSIPLKKNLDLLWAQGETDASKIQPYSGKGGRILFSKPRGENAPVQFKEVDRDVNQGNVTFALYHTDQVSFGEVYETMLPEDQWFIKEVIDDDAAITLDEMFPETIDVYEDYESGATFAIPTMLSDDLAIEQDAGHTYVEAFSRFSEDSRSFVKLIVFIDNGGLQAKDTFKNYILSGEALNDDDWGDQDWQGIKWVQDDESDDDAVNDLNDPNEAYYHEIMERIYERQDDEGNVIDDGEVYAAMTINENGVFLGVAIIVNDPSSLTEDDLINYYLMEACLTMAGFPYE
ncbi:MAG: hypothetical protein ACREOI_23575 [bacterium]